MFVFLQISIFMNSAKEIEISVIFINEIIK